MNNLVILLTVILLMDTYTNVNCKRSLGLGGNRNTKKNIETRRGNNRPSPPDLPVKQQPSSNIGPGGYPVQQGFQNPSSVNTGVKPPPYSAQVPQGHTSFNPVNPPAYSPKKVIVNNHYHYSGPPHHGSYGGQSSFGYPAGGGFMNSRPSYGGMGLFSSGHNSYGYPGSGGWGMPSYGAGRPKSGGLMKGVLIGAVTGVVATSLIRSVSNPWGATSHGYGAGYEDGYNAFLKHQAIAETTDAPAVQEAPAAAVDPVNPCLAANATNQECQPAAVPPVYGIGPSIDVVAYAPGDHYGGIVREDETGQEVRVTQNSDEPARVAAPMQDEIVYMMGQGESTDEVAAVEISQAELSSRMADSRVEIEHIINITRFIG